MATNLAPVPLKVELFLAAAEQLGYGARVIDPEFGYLWALDDGHGYRRVFVGSKLPLNDVAAVQVATDKYYQGLLLAELGVQVPRSVRCLSPQRFGAGPYRERVGIGPGVEFARSLGEPVIVKPNALSHGIGVRCIASWEEVGDAVETLFDVDKIVLVQEVARGREFRFNLLDGELLLGYERAPLIVCGDGVATLDQLLVGADPRFGDDDTRVARLAALAESSALAALRAQGVGLDAVITAGRVIDFSHSLMSLSHCATARAITTLPEAWLAWLRWLGDALHLRWFGIDLRVPSVDADPSEAIVIEINATPVMDQFALSSGRDAALEAHVRVLRALTQRPRFRIPRITS